MIISQDEIIVSPLETEKDFIQATHCVSEAFGRQTKDCIWIAMNPGWDTEVGQAVNARDMMKRWKSTTINKHGKPNTIFLKATVPDPTQDGERRVAGLAIWRQLSYVDGCGDPFTGDMSEVLDKLDDTEKRFGDQIFRSLWKRRIEYLRQVSDSDRDPPAIFTLDTCAVDPAFQRRGIAAKLVQAGLQEAKQRGNLECTTEGFKDENEGDIVFDVDDEFKARDLPPNVFLRTWV
ncbi:hypothetical protein GQ44DRAFT_709179 [Phaeosphaeriaceae sp. PMI808]|nr:hypothetical protein GQ44DRAFT_709179 [Phaeosphaeriaceae sp. PMI808]